jgi:hypothetical protein
MENSIEKMFFLLKLSLTINYVVGCLQFYGAHPSFYITLSFLST